MNKNKKEKNKIALLQAGLVVFILVAVGITGYLIYNLFASDDQEIYTSLPENMIALGLEAKNVKEVSKADVYEMQVGEKKKDLDLSLTLMDRAATDSSTEPLRMGDTLSLQKKAAERQMEQKNTPVPIEPKRSSTAPKKSQTVRASSPVEPAASADNNMFGQTIAFSQSSASRKNSPAGSVKACINKGGAVGSGDIIQVRLLEPFGDMPKNTVLTATCQLSDVRLYLVFNNMNAKAFDMDGLEGLAISDSRTQAGAEVLKDEAQSVVQSGAEAISPAVGTGVNILTRIFSSNRNRNSRTTIEVPTAYALYLKSN